IVEPLVCRRKTYDAIRLELVAGERRLRAAKLARLPKVPVIIRQLTDDQALEIMVIENNQRQDVNPLEEGDGYAKLLQLRKREGFGIEQLAARIGRSTKYVYDRIKLLDLIPAARKLVLDGTLTAGHAILIARLKKEQQESAVDFDNRHIWSVEGVLTNPQIFDDG